MRPRPHGLPGQCRSEPVEQTRQAHGRHAREVEQCDGTRRRSGGHRAPSPSTISGPHRSRRASATWSAPTGPSLPSRSARVRASRRIRCRPAGGQPTGAQLTGHQSRGGVVERRRPIEGGGGEFGVDRHPAPVGEAAGPRHPLGDGGAGLPPSVADEIALRGPVDPESDVEAVEERSGQSAGVAGPGRRRAAARPGRTTLATGARIHGRHQQEAGRTGGGGPGTAQPDDTLLERLAQGVEHGGREFAELVEEERPAVGQAHLARPQDAPPPIRATADRPWCGARNGGRRTGAPRPVRDDRPPEWIRAT